MYWSLNAHFNSLYFQDFLISTMFSVFPVFLSLFYQVVSACTCVTRGSGWPRSAHATRYCTQGGTAYLPQMTQHLSSYSIDNVKAVRERRATPLQKVLLERSKISNFPSLHLYFTRLLSPCLCVFKNVCWGKFSYCSICASHFMFYYLISLFGVWLYRTLV